MQRAFAWIAMTFVAASFSGTCRAQNWLSNGEFAGGTGGWSRSIGNSSSFGYYNSSEGYSSPGAAGIVVGFEGNSINFSQCVDMTSQSIDLVFYSKVLYTGGGPNIGSGSVSFFSTPGCAGGYLGNSVANDVQSLAGGWKRQALLNRTAPAGTLSAMVFLQNSVGVGGTSAGVIFDDAAFGPANTFTDVLFENGFE